MWYGCSNLGDRAFSPKCLRWVLGVQGNEDDPGVQWFFEKKMDPLYFAFHHEQFEITWPDDVDRTLLCTLSLKMVADLACELRFIGHKGGLQMNFGKMKVTFPSNPCIQYFRECNSFSLPLF